MPKLRLRWYEFSLALATALASAFFAIAGFLYSDSLYASSRSKEMQAERDSLISEAVDALSSFYKWQQLTRELQILTAYAAVIEEELRLIYDHLDMPQSEADPLKSSREQLQEILAQNIPTVRELTNKIAALELDLKLKTPEDLSQYRAFLDEWSEKYRRLAKRERTWSFIFLALGGILLAYVGVGINKRTANNSLPTTSDGTV